MNSIGWKKSLSLILFVTIFALPAMAQTPGMASYTHKTEGFTVSYPSDWEARENVTYDIYKIPFLAVRPLQSENDTLRENINVVTEKISPSLHTKEYLAANLKLLPKGLQNFKAVNQGVLTGGIPQTPYLVYLHNASGSDLKAIVFFFTKGNKGYTLTCTSSPKAFDSYLKLFLALGKSFKLR